MKAFDKLTDEEVVALNTTTIDRYIDLECAEQGVPLLPTEAPTPPGKDKVVPNLRLFTVGAFHFYKRKDAEKIREALQSTSLAKLEYLRLDGYTTDYKRQAAVEEYEVVPIGEVDVFTPDTAEKSKLDIQRFNDAKAAYDAEKKGLRRH